MQPLSVETQAILAAIEKASSSQNAQIQALFKEHEHMAREITEIKRGFPGEDIDGHRRYHEAVIASIDRRNIIYGNIVEKILTGGVLGVAAWLFYVIAQSAVETLKGWIT